MNKCLVFDKRLDVANLKPRSLLCVGGTRSGKSDFALHYAQNVQGPKTFIATMQKSFVAFQFAARKRNGGSDFKKTNDVAKMISDTQIPLVLVSNEVGMGIVPMYEEARIFRDIQGKANQIFAEACEAVITFSCGIPILIKG